MCSEACVCNVAPAPVARRRFLVFLFIPPLTLPSSHSTVNAFTKLLKYSSKPAQQFFSITPSFFQEHNLLIQIFCIWEKEYRNSKNMNFGRVWKVQLSLSIKKFSHLY